MQKPQSETIYRFLNQVLPGGVNSPVRSFKEVGGSPLVAERGEGEWLIDADGNRYLDFCQSWGALIHGHAHPEILRVAGERMAKGTSFGLTTAIEGQLAVKIRSLMPSMERIRFVSTGTEATMSAVRLARGYTGRQAVVKFNGNYHGHADLFLVKAGSGVSYLNEASSAGVSEHAVQETYSLPYNDEAAVEAFFKEGPPIAAVVIEPVAGNMGVVPADPHFLKTLRRLTEAHGALLIFDEVMTGFRVAKGGAQSLYGIRPDLTCLAKIIGGGFPAAAFGGRREIMEKLAPLGPVYQAGTLSGNPVAMEAGLQTLELLDQPGFYEELQRKVDRLCLPIEAFLQTKELPVCLQRKGAMFALFFGARRVERYLPELDLPLFARFFQEMLAAGIYPPPSQYEAWFVSQAHSDAGLDHTREAVLKFLNQL